MIGESVGEKQTESEMQVYPLPSEFLYLLEDSVRCRININMQGVGGGACFAALRTWDWVSSDVSCTWLTYENFYLFFLISNFLLNKVSLFYKIIIVNTMSISNLIQVVYVIYDKQSSSLSLGESNSTST